LRALLQHPAATGFGTGTYQSNKGGHAGCGVRRRGLPAAARTAYDRRSSRV